MQDLVNRLLDIYALINVYSIFYKYSTYLYKNTYLDKQFYFIFYLTEGETFANWKNSYVFND